MAARLSESNSQTFQSMVWHKQEEEKSILLLHTLRTVFDSLVPPPPPFGSPEISIKQSQSGLTMPQA